MMRYFVETERYRYMTYHSVRVCQVYAGMLRRAPDARVTATGWARSTAECPCRR